MRFAVSLHQKKFTINSINYTSFSFISQTEFAHKITPGVREK